MPDSFQISVLTRDAAKAGVQARVYQSDLPPQSCRARSFGHALTKLHFECRHPYQLFVTDTALAHSDLLRPYTAALERFGNQGVLACAAPEFDAMKIAQWHASDVVHEDADYTVVRAGLYAAHLAALHSIPLNGLVIAPRAVRNAHLLKLEPLDHPQRYLAMEAAYHKGLVLLHGPTALPQGHPAPLEGTPYDAAKRDCGIGEHVAAVDFLLGFYGKAQTIEPGWQDLHTIQYDTAFRRMPALFAHIAAQGRDAAFQFLRAVQLGSDILQRPLFWDVAFDYIPAHFDPRMQTLFRACCHRLENEFGGVKFCADKNPFAGHALGAHPAMVPPKDIEVSEGAAPATFRATILTYNRRDTLADHLEYFLDLGADATYIVDNGSTDDTVEYVRNTLAARTSTLPVHLVQNHQNLGYSRSFTKAFFDAGEEYHVFLSDEDAPTAEFLDIYRAAVARFGPHGVITKAIPYPKMWMHPQLDEKYVTHDCDAYTVIKPGLYAAHLANFTTGYIGATCIAPNAIHHADRMNLEQAGYPQRFLAMDAAFHSGLILVKTSQIGAFPEYPAAEKGEFMTTWRGDWAVAEQVYMTDLLLGYYGTNPIEKADFDIIEERQMRHAYTRPCVFFTLLGGMDTGQTGLHFLQCVLETSPLASRPIFWCYFLNGVVQTYTPELRAAFSDCCRQLDIDASQNRLGRLGHILHNHRRFDQTQVAELLPLRP